MALALGVPPPREGRAVASRCASARRRLRRRAAVTGAAGQAGERAAAREAAKGELREALKAAGGDTSDDRVAAALRALAPLCPSGGAADAALMCGDGVEGAVWSMLSKPDFPDLLDVDDAGRCIFSLGRLSFGRFAPVATRCAVDAIDNPVGAPCGRAFGYDFIVRFEVLDGPAAGARGLMRTFGEAEMPEEAAQAETSGPDELPVSGRVAVKFTGGGMRLDRSDASFDSDAEVELSERWRSAFGADAVAADRAAARWHKKVLSKVFGWLLGVNDQVSESVSDEFTQSYTLARSPKGFFDVLYVDETMRVTRGNAGTVVVVER